LFAGEIVDKRVDTDLLRFSGPGPGQPWNIDQIGAGVVGNIAIELPSEFSALLSYQAGNDSGVLVIEPFQIAADGPYTGVWWEPAKSGQGVTIQQQNDQFWGVWNLYDENSIDQWLLFQGVRVNGVLNTELLRFSGPAFGTDWDSSQVTSAAAGMLTLEFPAEAATQDSIVFRYSLNGIDGELQLVPFPNN
jgi:hypothetical protein